MKYVFDTNSLIVLFKNFYKSRFPTLWHNYNELLSSQKIISVREVSKEITTYYNENDRLTLWAKENAQVFQKPNKTELQYVTDMFKNNHFQGLISQKSVLEGKPAADPFVIAKAKVLNGYVVTQEKYKENAAKIPNVCVFFDVACIYLEGFMEKESGQF